MPVSVRFATTVLAFAAVALLASTASADIYGYTDADGVMHFTNIEPQGKKRRKWKRLYRTSKTGKASARRGADGCKNCDVVPARDHSRQRYGRYDEWILQAAALYQLPVALIRAVIHIESDYDPRVVSSAGARGLMQLMPAVCEDMRVTDVHDPRQNIFGGARLLRILANRFDGDLVLTLAAYHAGPTPVVKYGTVPPYQNTQRYVKMVVERYRRYKARAEAGPRGDVVTMD